MEKDTSPSAWSAAAGRRAPRSRRWPVLALCLAAACSGGGGSGEGGGGGGGGGQNLGTGADFEVSVSAEERSGTDQPALPVRFGLPFPAGELEDAVKLEWELSGGDRIPAESAVLARHDDGSVRWLQVEALAPAMSADSSLTGVLKPRQGQLPHPGSLALTEASGSQPLKVEHPLYTFRSSSTAGELFTLTGKNGGGLSAAASFELETAAGVLSPVAGGAFTVEQHNPLALHLVRRDDFEEGGVVVARLTTRLSFWRGDSALRWQQTLEILRETHAMVGWRLNLPLASPGADARLVDTDGAVELVSGDFTRTQVDQATLRRDGSDESGRHPGAVGFAGTQVAARHFWQLAPTTLERSGDTLRYDFCPEVDSRREALDAGFGRTVELWLRVGPEADSLDPAGAAAGVAAPLLPHADADWYCDSGVLGPLGESLPGDHALLEEKIAQSTDLLFWKNDTQPEWNYGIQHYGDFFDRENGLAYWGAQQQEYDPAFVMVQQFLRTGDVDYLEPALDCAWHYADVDTSWYGGTYQHRASQHHVGTHIAKIVAADYRANWEAWPQYDGSLDNAFDWLLTMYLPGFIAKIQQWMEPEQRRGIDQESELELVFLVVGYNEVNRIGQYMPSGTVTVIRDFAAWYAAQSEMQAYGYTDPDAQFADFFDLHGGSWSSFPSFHVDDTPIPQERHTGGHSLIQGVILGHLLSGEPRFREVALAFGEHQIEDVVPWAVDTIVEERDTTSEYLYMRTVAWPLVNLLSLAELCSGMEGEEQLAADALAAAQTCVTTIIETPIDRYRSSIHAGLALEGLSHWDRRTADPVARAYLHQLARTWAATQYDWNDHAFRYKSFGVTETFRGMTGLLALGLAYSESLEHDQVLYDTLMDAWDNLPVQSSYAKAYGMLYRGAPRALAYIRNFPAPSP